MRYLLCGMVLIFSLTYPSIAETQSNYAARARRAVVPIAVPNFKLTTEEVDPISIVGSESVVAGTLQELDASGSQVETFSWNFPGMPAEGTWKVYEGGKVVAFAIQTPGTYYLNFAGAKNGDKDNPPKLFQRECRVVVTAPVKPVGPTPVDPVTPGPGPNRPEPPPVPSDRFGLARFVKTTIGSNVSIAEKPTCALLASNYTNVASQLKDGSVNGFNVANAAVVENNRKTIGTASKDRWNALIFTALGNEMKRLSDTKVLDVTKKDDLIEMYSEVAQGFSSVATSN